MRLLFASVAILLFAGCAASSGARRAHDDAVNNLAREVSLLPPSESRMRMGTLILELKKNLSLRGSQSGDKTAELEKLAIFAAAAGPVEIELAFATAAKDWSGDGADDGIEIHIVPRDETGSAIKCPGSAKVRLLETDVGLFRSEQTVDEWVVSVDTLRHSWNESLFPAYVVPLAWHAKSPPAGMYKLIVEFAPLYGQSLSEDKTLEVGVP